MTKMKTRSALLTTIDKVYCRPKNEEEWKMVEPYGGIYEPNDSVVFDYDGVCLIIPDNDDDFVKDIERRTEIPVKHFIDLFEDRIVPWRLEEVGFSKQIDGYQSISFEDCSVHVFHGSIKTSITVQVELSDIELNISTFTELLQLLKFLNHDKKH